MLIFKKRVAKASLATADSEQIHSKAVSSPRDEMDRRESGPTVDRPGKDG